MNPPVMKIILLLVFAAFLRLGGEAAAQSFSIDWYTIDGGGGASTGGGYSLAGSIGQPDAGVMSGGGFSLEGGFWAVVAVQTPGSPLLTIRHTPTNTVVVSWPATATGFVLQQSANLNTGIWGAPSETVSLDGANKFIIVNPPTGNRFYRLRAP
jgi:hypothetical protein